MLSWGNSTSTAYKHWVDQPKAVDLDVVTTKGHDPSIWIAEKSCALLIHDQSKWGNFGRSRVCKVSTYHMPATISHAKTFQDRDHLFGSQINS